MDFNIIKKTNDDIIKNKEKYTKFQRDGLDEIERLLKNKRGVIIGGLRQIGKTTILKQLRIKNHNSIFISIKNNITPEEIKILNETIHDIYFEGNITLFLIDEIQNIKEWGYFLTDLSNVMENAKFVVSGSASLHSKHSRGSARFITYQLLPLSISEIRRYKNIDNWVSNKQIFKNYVGYKSIFAYINDDDIDLHNLYKEYLESYIFEDIRKYNKNIKINDLLKILEFMKNNTSGEVVKADLIKYTEKDNEHLKNQSKKTKYNYLDKLIWTLEEYNLVKTLRRFSWDMGLGKSYKMYLNPHLYLILMEIDFSKKEIPNGNVGYFYESYIYFYKLLDKKIQGYIKQSANAKKFRNNEIDFITEDQLIEVKASENIVAVKKALKPIFTQGNKKDVSKLIISFCDSPKILGIKNINFYKLLDQN